MADESTTMASLIANSGKTDPKMWEAFGNIPKAYYEGQDQAYKQRMRDAFSDSNGGLPVDAQGNFDAGKAWERLVKLGGAPGVDSAAKLAETGFQQDRYRNAPSVEGVLRGDGPQESVVGPATGRNSVSIDPAQRTGMGTPQPQPQPQPAAYGGPVQAGPNGPQPVAPQMQPPVRPQAAATPAAPPAAATDPTLGGLIPAGYEPGAYVRRLEAVAGSGRVLPDQLKVLQARIEGIRKALEPTPDMKNARAAGMPLKDYLDRSDTNMAERDILTKSILPKLDKSQDTATAARDEIQAIHRSREQLDAPGGIFSGSAADVRLKVAKVAEFLGVPNADKISNTEAFGSAIGSRTLALVKGLGAGAGISNADRDFAAAMAGGNIKLDEKSIRKILDIGETAARARIDQHNGLADRTLKSTESLKGYSDVYRVQQPGQYQRIGAAPPPQRGDVVDGHRFLGGNPRDPRSWGSL